MRIFVCIKPMPDTSARIKVGKDGKTIDPDGVKFELGNYDSRAMAKAAELKAQLGAELVIVTSGAEGGERDAKKRIKDGLALGGDRGIYIPDATPENRDPYAVAQALAAAIKQDGDVGLVLLGRQAMDDQALSVGPMVATILGLPCVTDAVGLEVQGDKATVKRAAEGRTETLEVKLPAVISAQRDLAEEKHPKLKDIMASGKKKIDTFAFSWPEPAYTVVGLTPPPERVAGKIVGEGPDAVPALLDLLQNEAKKLSF